MQAKIPCPRRSGFTLLEVMLVMAILVILAAVALPSLEAMYGDTKLRGAADEVRGAWAEARARAIDSGNNYRFAIKAGTGRYRVAPDSPDFWDGTNESAEDGDTGQVLTGSLPKGITFGDGNPNQNKQALPETASGWRVLVTFLPDGTCKIPDGSDYAKITLTYDGSMLIVSVRALTGIVTVRTLKQEEGR
jgi:prepilin-type N-terminal cleavage/methylation domain-containing protein